MIHIDQFITTHARGALYTIPLLLALAGMAAYATFVIAHASVAESGRSNIDAPTVLIRQHPDMLTPALHAVHQEGLSENYKGMGLSLHGGDYDDYFHHFANISAQKGWYTYNVNMSGYKKLKVVLPERDRSEIHAIKQSPYQWLAENHNDALPAIQPSLGDNPLYVYMYTTREGNKVAILNGAAAGTAMFTVLLLWTVLYVVAIATGFFTQVPKRRG